MYDCNTSLIGMELFTFVDEVKDDTARLDLSGLRAALNQPGFETVLIDC